MSGTSGDEPGVINTIHAFFAGWRFPVLLLFCMLFSAAALGIVLVFPSGEGPFATFAQEFRRWCFGQDGSTGELQWGYVVAYILQPLLLAAVALAVWQGPLREALRRPRVFLPWVAAAFVLVATAAVGLGLMARSGRPAASSEDELEFPAEDLRIAHVPPEFSLIDHRGEPISLAALKGRVVMVTAVYATCGLACPMILQQSRRVVAGLSPEEQAGLTVVAITLDPERDTTETLAEMARLQKVDASLYRLVTGEPAAVNGVLDRFGFARERNPETGEIDHANLFFLIDRAGRVAYRFSMGELQERWMQEALKLLLKETPAG